MNRPDEEQLTLFGDGSTPQPTPVRIGRSRVTASKARSILTKTTGFMSEYDYSLNPYTGCTYGCTYCYAAFFVRDESLQADWGNWVSVKQNSLELLRKMRTDLSGKTVYMSSVTDPYQPIERRLGLVRDILHELLARNVRLVVQTRSPLVTRDIDLLSRFDHVRVNMTVTTDSRAVQRVFEPRCPSPGRRMRAIKEIRDAGIKCSVTMTPLLPVADPEQFISQLLATGVEHFVVQPFHATRGKFVAGTGQTAIELVRQMNWGAEDYLRLISLMKQRLPRVEEGREGFLPE